MKLSERLNNLTKEYREAVAEWEKMPSGFEKKWLGLSLVDAEIEMVELSKQLVLFGDKEL